MNRRVVITGIGAITPLGNNAAAFWEGIKEGKNGIGPITHFDTTDFKVKLAAEVKDFSLGDWMEKKEERRMDRFCQMGMAAAIEAYQDSGLEGHIDAHRLAVMTGSGIGGLSTIENEQTKLLDRGPRRVSPLMIPMIIGNILAGNIAIRFGAKGLCHSLVTACATGTHCLGEAYYMIRDGRADAIFAGAAEATITPLGVAGFTNMTALSTKEDPQRASIPFDKERDGFVMGEGAGMLILEDLEHAKARGAHIYAEVVGYGSTCDAHHITSPDPTGEGDANAMIMAMEEAGITPKDLSYINAHGTSTPYNDLYETVAIKRALGDEAKNVPISSTKSMTGHMLGAAGAVEAIICARALQEGFIPATINYQVPDEELDLDYVPNQGRKAELTYALSNSLGFGGHNGAIILKKWSE
ncbi:beta-ketoacyl-ACP synthase II [Solibaculum mannosilyticum]|uniref:3-oxoacyl-[acyl-carrier-protein] synthase 2 n=1 Tax=Solibaculum mannosilyticum TaxID=2780922 RepID=A0A7I8CZ45_9FIRM|nr:beta-ketoacyl-ACP synthase II [Solibaculum mannosilyticum]BCI59760.1 3-oxoacyl-[acyl-carrier-protein] synthase 2 [Solibaculum mannosilyticum]CZT56359.1 3-oxoacyl-[acyl-carrier-protein] synthase 2 [Eubacteriaceae bacterium CHKCI005]